MKIIVTIASITLLAVGCSSLSPSPAKLEEVNSKTAQSNNNLNIYRNSEFGFEISYPADYGYMVADTEDNMFFVWFGRKPVSEEGPVEYSISVKKNKIVDEYNDIKNYKEYRNVRSEDITVNDQTFKLVEWQQPAVPGDTDYVENQAALIVKNNLLYRIDLPFASVNILKDFKFF